MFKKGIFGSIISGITGFFERRSKLKELKAKNQQEILVAQTEATVNRIKSNTVSDNEIDLIINQNNKHTYKDEILTYLILFPLFIASASPIITAFKTSTWTNLLKDLAESYQALSLLPEWYPYALLGAIVHVYGFRSFLRKFVDVIAQKFLKKTP